MISKIQSNNNKVNFGALKFKPIELGERTQGFLNKASDLSSVHQRLAIGGFALLIQPLIDMGNKDVEEKTRKTSAVRSAAKAIIGTATGIAVRGGCMKLAELKYAQREAGKVVKDKNTGKILIDPKLVEKAFGKGFEALNLDNKALSDAIKRVPSVVGTIAALGVMLFTNFLIDAPLTNITMEKINKFMDSHFAKKEEKKGGVNG